MAYGLPVRGQGDWDDELNNSVESLRGDVQSAVADAASAKSNATTAISSADAAKAQAALSAQSAATAAAAASAPADEAVEAVLTNPASVSSAVLSATYATHEPTLNVKYATLNAADYTGRSDAVVRVDLPAGVTNNEATHPSVLHFPEGWNGYRYWMAFTPYLGGNDATEDPWIVTSQDGRTWATPTGLTNPLDDAPGGSQYNSDTELAISPDGATLYLMWRQRNDGATGAEEIVYLRSSTDGVTWTARQAIVTANKATEILASPAVIHDGTQWVMWTVDVVANPNVLKRRTASTITGTWSAPTSCTVTGLPTGRDLWHLAVLKLGGQYVALLNDCALGINGTDGELYLMTSTNQTAWTLNPTTLVSQDLPGEYNSLYRGCLVPTYENGRLEFDMWHGAWMSGASPVNRIYYRRLTPQVAATGGGSGAGVGCLAWRTTILTIPTNTVAYLDMDAENFDTDGFHSTATNPSRITIPAGLGGLYMVNGVATLATDNSGGDERSLLLYKNGAIIAQSAIPPMSGVAWLFTFSISAPLQLAAGDYLQLALYQNSGAVMYTGVSAGRLLNHMSVTRIGS